MACSFLSVIVARHEPNQSQTTTPHGARGSGETPLAKVE